jgi:hypothetical protein
MTKSAEIEGRPTPKKEEESKIEDEVIQNDQRGVAEL